MTTPLTPQDWETLSAYLDGQLTVTDKRQIQDLIALRPELKQGLEELRRTQAVLRAAPKRRAPRNFTLSPAMAQKARPRFRWGWTPSFSFASALATILLVLSFFFRLSPGQLSSFTPIAAQAPLTAAQENASSGENPPIIVWNQPGFGGGSPVGGMGGAESSAGKGTGPAVDSQAAPEATPPVVEANPSPDLPPAMVAAPTETPASTAAPGLAAPLASPPTARAGITRDTYENGPILGIAPTEERGKMYIPTQAIPYPSERTAADNWMYVQIGLAGVAVIFALAAFFTWRKAHH